MKYVQCSLYVSDLGPSIFSRVRVRVRVHWRLTSTSTSTLVMDEYEYEYILHEYIPMSILSNDDVYNHTSDHTY